MDETPEELAQIRSEADKIDVNRYRKRFRALAAVGVGAFAAGLVFLVLEMVDSRRNPCERVRDYLCAQGRSSPECAMYGGVVAESVESTNPQVRGNIRAQCESKIARLKDEAGVDLP